jgi:hypothetical protein
MAGIGSPKGAQQRLGRPNKFTAEIKEMIEGALQDVGGRAYLAEQARDNPVAFMGLIGKILPKDINANIKSAVTFVLSKEDIEI